MSASGAMTPLACGAVRTTCPYCGVGCGVRAEPTGAREALIRGDADHPANRGRLCSKGTHLGETIGLEGRLLRPVVHGREASWDEATRAVAQGITRTIAEHGPESVAFYISGQLLTEDYYVANKLMKGYIGTANIDTNSRLCMASAVAAHCRAFGEDVVPCTYDDLEAADLILLVGSNTAWCHPIVWQRIEAGRAARGTKLVVIDPRRTETAAAADLHLAVRPNGDAALFNGLLAQLAARGLLDHAYLRAHVEAPAGFWDALEADPARTAAESGVAEADFLALVDLLARHPRTLTLFSQGVNQSVGGTDKGNAIINLHLATGRIGKPGTGPFSITGQPNAMGGREVGGLSSMLAAHMGFTPAEQDRARRFWNSPTICAGPGLKAVDMFRAVHDGRIKMLWIMATNPAVSMPDAGFVREALARCPLVVVSDAIAGTDTTAYAHVLLPALAWGEKDGTVTNSERRISRQRPFLPPPDEARADWRIVCDVARAMGHGGFDFASPAAVFREYAAQTAFENDGARRLDLGPWATLSDADYDALAPVLWSTAHPFADGRYSTPDRRARLVAVASPPAADVPGFPLRLNTGRYRDQWHTMTRTGLSPRLCQHRREPLVEVHPDDARRFGLADGGLAHVRSPSGASVFRVQVTDTQQRGALFVPMHWSDQFSAGGRTGRLPDQSVDPVSGQPGFKDSAAAIRPYPAAWQGFLVCRDLPVAMPQGYWTRIRVAGGWLIELAGQEVPDVDTLLPPGARLEALDRARGAGRYAVLDHDRGLIAALFLTCGGRLPDRGWLVAQLQDNTASGLEVLAGRPALQPPDCGAIVCACFDVGVKTILTAITEQHLTSVEAIGTALKAGTNCGSCRSAIRALLPEERRVAHG